ncbi:MAG TPA: MarR family transcriptional regulator [Solirubrobacterales bacterium]|jgi:DNA-binding MarR family transcriptional regulator
MAEADRISPAAADRRRAAAVALELRLAVGLLRRRLRQSPVEDDLTLPETAALARLDRGGPSTASALAREEQISPQSMGATLAGLEARGLIERASDPEDGRRVVLSLSGTGRQAIRDRRAARTEQLARALAENFTARELEQLEAAAPLLERLAESV